MGEIVNLEEVRTILILLKRIMKEEIVGTVAVRVRRRGGRKKEEDQRIQTASDF